MAHISHLHCTYQSPTWHILVTYIAHISHLHGTYQSPTWHISFRALHPPFVKKEKDPPPNMAKIRKGLLLINFCSNLRFFLKNLRFVRTTVCIFTWYVAESPVCAKLYLHVGHDSFICLTWLIHMCVVTPRTKFLLVLPMSHGTNINESWHTYGSWLIHMYDMTHQRVRCDPTNRTPPGTSNESWHKYKWVVAHIWVMTHSYVWHDSSTCALWPHKQNPSWYFQWVMAQI